MTDDANSFPVIFLLGSSPNNDGSLDPATIQRVQRIIERWTAGEFFHVVCMGRASNPNWAESEAACMRRHLLTALQEHTPPMPGYMVHTDSRPKSTAQSLQLIPEWEGWFQAQGFHITALEVVTNAAYAEQIETLREGQQLDARLEAPLRFRAAPNFAMTDADHKRLKRSLWKAQVDPFDRWINQWRVSTQPWPVRKAMLLADAAITVLLTLWRRLGHKPQPAPDFPPYNLPPLRPE